MSKIALGFFFFFFSKEKPFSADTGDFLYNHIHQITSSLTRSHYILFSTYVIYNKPREDPHQKTPTRTETSTFLINNNKLIMDMICRDRDRRRNSEKTIFSVFQANDYFVNKILTRNPSVGQSSRFYHSRAPGQVPFKWELLPGKPKDTIPVREEDYYTPMVIGPPPAVRSQGVPRPRCGSTGFRLRFWKRFKKNQHKLNKKLKPSVSWNGADHHDHYHETVEDHALDGLNKFGLSKPDHDHHHDEYLRSSSRASSSSPSSSTASSSSNSVGLSLQSSKFHRLAKGLMRWPF